MITENLSTLKIHKLTQAQYERELANNNADENALYLTPYGVVPIADGGTGATDAASALTNFGLTATATELNYLEGATGNIQSQIDALNSNSGGSGMVREFSKTESEIKAIDSTGSTYTTTLVNSKFYIVDVTYAGVCSSITVDWMSVRHATNRTRQFGVTVVSAGVPSTYIFIATVNSDSTVTFNAGVGTINHICGYY